MKVTHDDYRRYRAKEVTPQDLARIYNISLSRAYLELKYFREPERQRPRLLNDEKADLRRELLQAKPWDPEYGIKPILQRWGIPTYSEALRLAGLKSLKGPDGKVLKRLGFKREGNILYNVRLRGRHRHRHQIVLLPEDLKTLTTTPIQWVKDNIERLKEVVK